MQCEVDLISVPGEDSAPLSLLLWSYPYNTGTFSIGADFDDNHPSSGVLSYSISDDVTRSLCGAQCSVSSISCSLFVFPVFPSLLDLVWQHSLFWCIGHKSLLEML